MKSYIDKQKVSRRALFANIASIGGMILLLVSILFPLYRPLASGAALIMMAAGLGIAMVGIYFANRWVRKPRPEIVLDHVLKGMNDSYKIYHYPALPSDHILLTQNGIFVLETVNLSGSFSYKDRRWREKMTLGRAMRYVVEEHLGDPIKLACNEAELIEHKLSGRVDEGSQLKVQPIVVFTHPGAALELDNPPVPVVKADKLKKAVTKKSSRLSPEDYAEISQWLEEIS